MISQHLRLQLLRGLDLTHRQPSCPFPSCHDLVWPEVDGLLYHYATDHMVLEKVLLRETELVTAELRRKMKTKDATFQEIVEKSKIQEQELVTKRDEVMLLHTEVARLKVEHQLELVRLREEAVEQDTPTHSPEVSSSDKMVVHLANVRSYGDDVNDTKQREEMEAVQINLKNEVAQNQVLRKENEELKLKLENCHLHIGNLSKIAKMEKSTEYSTNKKIQDLTEENETLKARELEISRDLLRFERNLSALDEEKGRLEKQLHAGTVQNQEHLRTTHERELKKLRDELVQETAVKQDQQQKVIKLSNEVKTITSMRDNARDKLCKLRDSLKQVEVAKRSLEADYKALVMENRAGATEIKTLKQINQNQKTGSDKEEVVNLKKELLSKVEDNESHEMNIKKLSAELSAVVTELRDSTKDCSKAEKVAASLNEESKDLKSKLKKKTEKYTAQYVELQAARTTTESLKERFEFYVGQCTEFELNEVKQKQEIHMLQQSIKETTWEQEATLKEQKSRVQELGTKVYELEAELQARHDQVEILIAEIEKPNNVSNEKNALVEELLLTQRGLMAQLRRKDWEIENYQRKLDITFAEESRYQTHNLLSQTPSTSQIAGQQALDLRLPSKKVEVDCEGGDEMGNYHTTRYKRTLLSCTLLLF